MNKYLDALEVIEDKFFIKPLAKYPKVS